MWVSGYSADVYAPAVGRGGQGLLQGAGACLRAPGVAVGALGRYGVSYRLYGGGHYCALYVAWGDGAEVRQLCCAAFAMVYPECVLQSHLGT